MSFVDQFLFSVFPQSHSMCDAKKIAKCVYDELHKFIQAAEKRIFLVFMFITGSRMTQNLNLLCFAFEKKI